MKEQNNSHIIFAVLHLHEVVKCLDDIEPEIANVLLSTTQALLEKYKISDHDTTEMKDLINEIGNCKENN